MLKRKKKKKRKKEKEKVCACASLHVYVYIYIYIYNESSLDKKKKLCFLVCTRGMVGWKNLTFWCVPEGWLGGF